MHGVTHTVDEIRERGVPGFEVEVIGTDAHVDRRLSAVAEVEIPFYPGLRVGNDELRSRVSADADQISALGASIAELNKQVLAAGANPSPDLLDKRDQMLEDLSGLVQVSVSKQSDGTIGVFIGSGQVLVLGTSASKLVMTSGNLDPSQTQLVLRSGSALMSRSRNSSPAASLAAFSISTARCSRPRAPKSAA